MLIITSSQRRTGFIWVLLLALLVLVPMAWLGHTLEELRIKDESFLEMQSKERLLNEMASFQEKLRPEIYVENVIDDLKQTFGLSNRKHANLMPGAEIDPKLIGEGFVASAAQFLTQKHGMTPFLIIAADCDLQNHYGWYSDPSFATSEEKQQFAKTAAHWIALGPGPLSNELPTTIPMRQRKIDFVGEDHVATETLHKIFSHRFHEHISVFSDAITTVDNCRVFFSNRYGSQRSYHLYHRITRIRGPYKTMLGGFYLIFNSADISPVHMLKKALSSEDGSIARFYLKQPVNQPAFSYSETHLQYRVGFPSYYLTLVEDYGIKYPDIRRALREFIDNNGLLVQIERQLLESPYRTAEKICAALGRLLLLFFVALLVRALMCDLEKGLSLAKKMRVAVAIAVMLPVTGVFLISEQARISSERLSLIRYQARIKQRMAFFEKILDDTDPRLILMLQEFKELLAQTQFGADKRQLYNLIRTGHFLKRKAAIIETSLDRNGNPLRQTWGKTRPQSTTLRAGLFRIMSDLGMVNSNSPEIKKLNKHQLLVSGIAGTLVDLFSNPDDLAREGLLTDHILSASALTRSSHHLLAPFTCPWSPEAIVVFLVDDPNAMQQLLKYLAYTALSLFTDYDENCQIDYALAIRSASSLRDTIVPFSQSTHYEFRKLAAAGLYSQSSSSHIKRDGDNLQLESWYYSGISPVIILAKARLKIVASQNIVFSLIPWMLLLYAILAVTLISDILADIFLAPVRAMLTLVRRIADGDLQASINISSGDEFQELGDSLNRMCSGLRQREKMRRFVSDRLFTSLQSDGDSRRPGMTGLSVISSDIRNFTTLSEQHSPEEIVSLLNDYISCMEAAIEQYDGSIEKIVGDAITAAFYPAPDHDKPANRACLAALAMKQMLHQFNQQRQQAGKFAISTGIGIASGEAVMGFASGGSRRSEFVLIGDVMRRAEDLEGLTKMSKGSGIFVDSETAIQCKMPVHKVTVELDSEKLECQELCND